MTIYFKRGHHYFLSNFHEEPFYFKGKLYMTAEHAYQASKADNEIGHDWVRKAVGPAQAKARGRNVIMRKNWDWIKVITMSEVVFAKFANSPQMQKLLIDTGEEELVEYTYWNDRFWGVGQDYKGRNELGIILMTARGYYRDSNTVSINKAGIV